MLFRLSEALEGFDIDSRIAWNFRLVVLKAGILTGRVVQLEIR